MSQLTTRALSSPPCPPAPLDATLLARLQKVIDGGPTAIQKRLNELGDEWSVGRITKVVLGVTIGLGLILAATLHVGWLLLALFGVLCLLQYLFSQQSLTGELVRGLGFRSGCAIDQERLALKALRGDFKLLPTLHEIDDDDAITRMEGEGGIAVEPEERKPDTRQAVMEVLEATRR